MGIDPYGLSGSSVAYSSGENTCKSARRIARLSKATAKARWVMSTEVAMVTWTQLLTFVLVIIAVIDLTVRARK